MQILKFILIFCLLSLGAEEPVGIPYSNIERGLPTLAGGCVNVISGDYVESVQDMAIAGPVPLSIDRFFTSSYYQEELHYGWVHNHVSSLSFNIPDPYLNPNWNGFYTDKSRGTYKFDGESDEPYHFSTDNFKYGYTNCMSEHIGSRSSLKKIVLRRAAGKYELKHPSLHVLNFSGPGLVLKEDIYPHGKFKLEYSHDNDKRLKEVTLRNQKKVFSKIAIDRDDRKILGMQHGFAMTGSDGKKVVYDLKIFRKLTSAEKEENHPRYYRISAVRSSFAPTINYEYVDRGGATGQKIASRSLPEGRCRSIEYYASGRVESITEPAGKDNALVKTYKFDYDYSKKEECPGIKRRTFVKDYHDHVKCYGIDENKRLKTVSHYKGVYTSKSVPSFIEKFMWSDEGDIRCQYIKENNEIKAAKIFRYDPEGNVVCEKRFGNYSGRSDPIKLYAGPSMVVGEGESYEHQYAYASGLLMRELEENGREIDYLYYPNTDLLAVKCVNKALNYSYEYDEDAVLIREEVGDGATEKRITSYLPRSEAPYGLPQKVEEKYFDFKTGKEHLLKKVEKKYSRQGHVLQEDHFDANGKRAFTLKWEYDAHGNVIKEQNAAGDWIERQYDPNDNLIYQKGPRQDYHKKFTYDLMNRLISEEIVWKEVVFKTTHEYDPMGQRTATTDHKGNRTEYKYDEEGRVVETSFPLLMTKITQEHDIFGNVTAMTDQRGNTTKKTYNIDGKPLTIAYPDGTHELFEYNRDGTLKKATAKNGFEKTYAYDRFGRLIEEKDAYSSKSFTYNTLHKIAETDAMGVETLYTYDGAGRLIEEEKKKNKITYTYDALGRLHKKIGAYAASITEYDTMNRVVEERVEDLKGNICTRTQFSYDADGNRTQEIRGDSHYQTTYDPLGNPLKTVDPLGHITTYEYKWDLHQVIETDPLENQTITTYNAMDKPAKITRLNRKGKLLAEKELEYDPCGNILKTTEAVIVKGAPVRSVITEWSYNEVNQIASLTESGVKTTKYRYNKYGQLATITRPDGAQINHKYDKKGRLSRHYSNDFSYDYTYNHNDQPTKVSNTERVYDSLGRLTSETLENGYTLQYTYDKVNRPTSLTLPDGSKVNYTYEGPFLKSVKYGALTHKYTQYDRSGYLLESQLPGNAGTIAYTYDLAHRTTAISHPHRSQQNTYDPVGNLTEFTVNGQTTRLSYDDLYQLSREDNTRYTHDSLHNRLKKDDIDYTINSLNQIVQQGDTHYDYDKNGNLILETTPSQTTQYRYDALDRLIFVKKNTTEYHYRYDGFNRRISKESNGITENYLYQTNQEIGSYRNNALHDLRILGKGKGAEIGATVAILKDSAIYIPLHNHNGSISALLDPSGHCLETQTYDAFGSSSGPSLSPWRFMSKRHDPETGFVYFGMRFYIPHLGRWLSPDPDGFNDGPNLYAFVRNNPFRNIDLYGLAALSERCMEHTLSPDLLSGKISFEEYEQQYDFSRPCVLSLGRPEPITGSGRGLINGVQTSLKDMVSHMQYDSDMYNGLNTIGFFTPGGSLASDLGWCGREHLFGENTESVKMVQNYMGYFFDTRPKESQFQLTAYSRGSIIAYNALSNYPALDQVKDRLSVATYGFAKYMPPEFASRVMNYASSSDPVALIGLATNPNNRGLYAKTLVSSYLMGGVAGCVKCVAGFRETNWDGITVLPRHPDEHRFIDHPFQSKTYAEGQILERNLFFDKESKIY